MKKRYLYNISFFYQSGNGAVQIIRGKKINSGADLEEVRRFIETRNDLKNVAIINFQLICKRWVKTDESLL